MPGRAPHAAHVFRLAVLFVAAFVAFLVVRASLVPADFGVYGFYRAGALDAARERAPQYAGESACLDCHSVVGDLRKEARHVGVKCEACHGPLALHASGESDVKPRALNPRLLCLQCHTQGAGKPLNFPQVVPADHSSEGPCTECHAPHRPKTQ